MVSPTGSRDGGAVVAQRSPFGQVEGTADWNQGGRHPLRAGYARGKLVGARRAPGEVGIEAIQLSGAT